MAQFEAKRAKSPFVGGLHSFFFTLMKEKKFVDNMKVTITSAIFSQKTKQANKRQ